MSALDPPPADPRSPTHGASARTLVGLLYDELRQLAAARLRGLPPGVTLQPTALVHEVWLRLEKRGDVAWNGRRHFFGAAARAMHDILVERARARDRKKRGGDHARVHEDTASGIAIDQLPIDDPAEDMLALHDVLATLERADAHRHEVVMLRYFAGLEQREIATLLGVSERTVERDWHFCRAWLRAAMERA